MNKLSLEEVTFPNIWWDVIIHFEELFADIHINGLGFMSVKVGDVTSLIACVIILNHLGVRPLGIFLIL